MNTLGRAKHRCHLFVFRMGETPQEYAVILHLIFPRHRYKAASRQGSCYGRQSCPNGKFRGHFMDDAYYQQNKGDLLP